MFRGWGRLLRCGNRPDPDRRLPERQRRGSDHGARARTGVARATRHGSCWSRRGAAATSTGHIWVTSGLTIVHWDMVVILRVASRGSSIDEWPQSTHRRPWTGRRCTKIRHLSDCAFLMQNLGAKDIDDLRLRTDIDGRPERRGTVAALTKHGACKVFREVTSWRQETDRPQLRRKWRAADRQGGSDACR